MPVTKVTMVNPGQIVCKRWKGMNTTKKVTKYARSWKVPCVSWYDPAARKRTWLVDWKSFYKAYCAWKKEAKKKTTRKVRKVSYRRKPKLSVVWSAPVRARRSRVKAYRKKWHRRRLRRAA